MILTGTWLEKGFQTGCNMKLVSEPSSSKLWLWERASATISPQKKCLFPLLAPSRKVGKRGSNWRWEKIREYSLLRPAAQNFITIKECCSFQHFGEKEYHSHAHAVTIYSGSTWTCMNQNTSVSCQISFIQTIEWTIFHYKKWNLNRQSTGFETVFLYFRRQVWV